MADNGEQNNSRQQDASQAAQLPPPPPQPTEQLIAPSGAFPGSLTPGWNDPPPLAATDNVANSNNRRPRLDLRKRVPYPMDGTTASTQPLEPLSAAAASNKPVAKVSPQQVSAPIDYGNANGNDNVLPPRLPPLAPGNTNISLLPVAKVPPRTK